VPFDLEGRQILTREGWLYPPAQKLPNLPNVTVSWRLAKGPVIECKDSSCPESRGSSNHHYHVSGTMRFELDSTACDPATRIPTLTYLQGPPKITIKTSAFKSMVTAGPVNTVLRICNVHSDTDSPLPSLRYFCYGNGGFNKGIVGTEVVRKASFVLF
jgi:hypothetical protein